MALVQLPDGTLAHFEDGVSPEEFRQYIVPEPSDAVLDQQAAPVDELDPPVSDWLPMRLLPQELELPLPAMPTRDAAADRPQFHRPFADVPILGPAYAASQAFQNGLTQGATFSFADEILAGIKTPIQLAVDAFQGKPFDLGRSYGESLEEMREYDRWVQEGNPWAHGAGNFAGSVLPGVGFAKNGLTLMNGAKPTLASFVPRAATEGAIYGAIQGFGSGDTWEDRVNLAIEGARMGALLGAATGAVGGSIASKSSQSAVPSVAQVGDDARALYEAAGQAGAMLPQQQSAAMANSMRQIAIDKAAMTHSGKFVEGYPLVAGVINELDALGQGPLSVDQVQSLRTFIENALKSPKDAERNAARDMLLEFHRYLDPISPEIATANAMYHRRVNADFLETLVRDAAREADQGKQSLDSVLRQRFGDLQQQIRKGDAQGFSEAERQAISNLAKGGSLERVFALIAEVSAPMPNFAASGAGVFAHLKTGDPIVGAGVGAAAGSAWAGSGPALRKGADALALDRARRSVVLSLLGDTSLPPAHPAISPVTQALIAGQSSQAPQINDDLMWFLSAPN